MRRDTKMTDNIKPYTEHRKIQQTRTQRGNPFHMNIPYYMAQMLKIQKGDTVEVSLDAKNNGFFVRKVIQ